MGAGPVPARGRRAERRRRLAEPDLDLRTFCRTKQMPGSTPTRMERPWDAWQAERHRRGGGRAAARLHRQPIPRALTTHCRNPQTVPTARLLPAPQVLDDALTRMSPEHPEVLSEEAPHDLQYE
jgi:hypothetical protein